MTALHLIRNPNTAEEAISLLVASIGSIQATTLTDAELSRVNEQLTRLALVVSLKFGERT